MGRDRGREKRQREVRERGLGKKYIEYRMNEVSFSLLTLVFEN